MKTEKVQLVGHIINTMSLSKVLDAILERGGDFRIDELMIGHSDKEISRASLEVTAPDEETLGRILGVISKEGAAPVVHQSVTLKQADKDGAVPEDFYSSTNLETEIFLDGQWIPVADVEMDCIIVVDREAGSAACVPIAEIRQGDLVVVGHDGIRVHPLLRDVKKREVFSFMSSTVSSEKPKSLVIQDIAGRMKTIREEGGKIAVVGGPTIVHTGAGKHLCKLIEQGYVHLLLAGNALATHDLELAFFGTSLGIRLKDGGQEEGGHRNHLRAINRIRNVGSIREAVNHGVLTSGIMYSCIENNVRFILAGSIRDDGPLPEVTERDISPNVPAKIHQDGIEARHGMEYLGNIVMGLDLGGVGVRLETEPPNERRRNRCPIHIRVGGQMRAVIAHGAIHLAEDRYGG